MKGAERALYLRHKTEADTIRERLAATQSVAVIGGGFIGLEFAAAARKQGKQVTVIEAAPRLMARAVPPLLSNFFFDVHRGEGVEILLGATLEEIEPDAVRLSDGSRRAADVVLAGIGVIPNTELAEDAGLAISNGIAVDEFLRTDARQYFRHRRLCGISKYFFSLGSGAFEENECAWKPSRMLLPDQAKCVARQIVGERGALSRCSVVLDRSVRCSFPDGGTLGRPRPSGRCAVTWRAANFQRSISSKNGALAADSINRFGDHIAVRKVLNAGTEVTPEQAGDESFDLKRVVLRNGTAGG